MSSHNPDYLIDDLFTQALQPLSNATPSRDAEKKLMRRFHGFPPRVLRLFTWLHSFSAQNFMLSNQPYFIELYSQYRPSPFLGVAVSQLSGLKITS
jgi:hypothetical protein